MGLQASYPYLQGELLRCDTDSLQQKTSDANLACASDDRSFSSTRNVRARAISWSEVLNNAGFNVESNNTPVLTVI